MPLMNVFIIEHIGTQFVHVSEQDMSQFRAKLTRIGFYIYDILVAEPPTDLISSTACCNASSLMSAKVTAAPAWAKARAVAGPMPEAAPVTNVTCPLKSYVMPMNFS
jgi:hypothetical protein